jgi:hypothetical protein
MVTRCHDSEIETQMRTLAQPLQADEIRGLKVDLASTQEKLRVAQTVAAQTPVTPPPSSTIKDAKFDLVSPKCHTNGAEDSCAEP